MSMTEDEYFSNLSNYWANERFNMALEEEYQRQKNRHFSLLEEDSICPYCGEPIEDGEDIIQLDSNEIAHLECFNEERIKDGEEPL